MGDYRDSEVAFMSQLKIISYLHIYEKSIICENISQHYLYQIKNFSRCLFFFLHLVFYTQLC